MGHVSALTGEGTATSNPLDITHKEMHGPIIVHYRYNIATRCGDIM